MFLEAQRYNRLVRITKGKVIGGQIVVSRPEPAGRKDLNSLTHIDRKLSVIRDTLRPIEKT
jgi:hypothetical protein